MPMWPSSQAPALERVLSIHQENTGVAATQAADAPATWLLLGEHVDYAGGVVLISQAAPRVAVAYSPRQDDLVKVTRYATGVDGISMTTDSVSIRDVAERAAEQQPTVDERGRLVVPPTPEGGLAARLSGIAWTMIHRQLLTRETAGMDVTVVDDIPQGAGLGAEAAQEAAFALALQGFAEGLDLAPTRTRLAEVCVQSAEMFAATPPLRARYTCALRGSGETISVIDYADGSLTQAPLLQTSGIDFFAIMAPGTHTNADEEIRRRRRFLATACQAFGTESLRLLPDAPQRVLEWLRAVHKVHGEADSPSLKEAGAWLSFHEEETLRARRLSQALRSRRLPAIWPLIAQSQSELVGKYDLHGASELAQLCLERGAQSARSAAAGSSTAVITGVDKHHAANFAADLSADGLLVIKLEAGEVAGLAEIS
ncbi:galactokinase family protein [Corynebacterium alimapuense]|uniref:Galactokinase n=1 Tax=Corynebacterium alimapuense TaxID=1576874 RepID=A0A3M8K8K6_9CORY|nr:galactokinase family protein [Corynebacterium alimapuense]RNE49551.1 galactokinase [Corynebacterium alimapuense]